MSAGGAFGGTRGARPVPPEKGIFPLDHLHQCDLLVKIPLGNLLWIRNFCNLEPGVSIFASETEKKDYLGCLKTSGHQSEKCRPFAKKYLQCRMAKNLMAKQDLSELGFKEHDLEVSKEENV